MVVDTTKRTAISTQVIPQRLRYRREYNVVQVEPTMSCPPAFDTLKASNDPHSDVDWSAQTMKLQTQKNTNETSAEAQIGQVKTDKTVNLLRQQTMWRYECETTYEVDQTSRCRPDLSYRCNGIPKIVSFRSLHYLYASHRRHLLRPRSCLHTHLPVEVCTGTA
jgi:hypothetical protein